MLAVVTLIEGVANVVLSILLVRRFGILGDAFGTALPLAGTYIFFMPHHLCSRLGIRVPTFLRRAYVLPLVLCIPMCVVLVFMQRYFVAHTYRQLAVELLTGGLVYASCLGWAHATNRAFDVGDLAPAAEKLIPEMAQVPPVVED